MKYIVLALAAAAIIIFLKQLRKSRMVEVTVAGHVIQAELADSAVKRAKGLMYRTSLPANTGMLFIFPATGKHAFWMANTKIPLDIIWIGTNYNILHIERNVQPCKTKNIVTCPSYTPKVQAKYVLEVNGGWVGSHDVNLSSKVRIIKE